MKTQLLILAVFLVSLALGYDEIQEGDPCSTYEPCGEKKLLKEEAAPCTNCDGPNVCKMTKTYMKSYYTGVYEKQCNYHYNYWYSRYIRYCHLECVSTQDCNVTEISTKKELHCCPGYTTNTTEHDYHHFWNRESKWHLKKYGCPRVLYNSTLDCLSELGLTEFAKFFTNSLKDELDSTNNSFTIFAAPNELVTRSNLGSLPSSQADVVIRSHILKEEIYFPMLYNGVKKMTISPGRFIHVNQEFDYSNGDTIQKPTYINGIHLIAPDACLAVNGVVHVIQGVIDSTDESIAQIVSSTPSFSTMESLLTKANLLSSLNDTHGFLMTLFVPDNDAFQEGSSDLKVDIVECLMDDKNRKQLKKFLKYHYTCDAMYSSVLVKKTELTTEACSRHWSRWYGYYRHCKSVSINVNDDGIQVGESGSFIETSDIPASNGVLHQISLPLINPWLDLKSLCCDFPYTPSPSPTTSFVMTSTDQPSPSPSASALPPPPPPLPPSPTPTEVVN